MESGREGDFLMRYSSVEGAFTVDYIKRQRICHFNNIRNDASGGVCVLVGINSQPPSLPPSLPSLSYRLLAWVCREDGGAAEGLQVHVNVSLHHQERAHLCQPLPQPAIPLPVAQAPHP